MTDCQQSWTMGSFAAEIPHPRVQDRGTVGALQYPPTLIFGVLLATFLAGVSEFSFEMFFHIKLYRRSLKSGSYLLAREGEDKKKGRKKKSTSSPFPSSLFSGAARLEKVSLPVTHRNLLLHIEAIQSFPKRRLDNLNRNKNAKMNIKMRKLSVQGKEQT